jgi:23S rRNA (cytidine1920-2'-O)/16S rRNA (cytidine1409-2'-O)-methyltransferase
MATRVRLDQLLVQRSLAPSRERAQALILAGAVRVDGEVADRAAAPVSDASAITVAQGPRFVSRGGEKLDAALDELGVNVSGRVALDVGSSTGGFTDCLLQRGAARVYAIDVGKGQLDWKLRTDARVVAREGVNAREGFELPEQVDLVVADVSFISLRIALLPSFRHLREGGDVVALVKPQFEAGRADVGKGGVVRERAVRARVLREVAGAALGWGSSVAGVVDSGLPGPKGNREFFLHLLHSDEPILPDDLDERIDAAVAAG